MTDETTESCPPQFLPSKHQRLQWWRFVMESDGTNENGDWLGHCPLHDDVMDPELPSAQFNFKAGVLRCTGDPVCHPGQRAMSLYNVLVQLMGRGAK